MESKEIENIRQNFIFFGKDCSKMTDNEIKENYLKLCESISISKCTKEQSNKVLKVFTNNKTK